MSEQREKVGEQRAEKSKVQRAEREIEKQSAESRD
jgi:hypothetical protein